MNTGEEERAPQSYDFARLERAVTLLAERKQQLQSENAELRRALADRDATLRALDLKLLETNQGREDARKHLDELIHRVESLEARFDR